MNDELSSEHTFKCSILVYTFINCYILKTKCNSPQNFSEKKLWITCCCFFFLLKSFFSQMPKINVQNPKINKKNILCMAVRFDFRITFEINLFFFHFSAKINTYNASLHSFTLSLNKLYRIISIFFLKITFSLLLYNLLHFLSNNEKKIKRGARRQSDDDSISQFKLRWEKNVSKRFRFLFTIYLWVVWACSVAVSFIAKCFFFSIPAFHFSLYLMVF